MPVGRGCRQAMDQAALIIHSHVELHAQVPLVPLPGLLHLWVPFSFPVLRRGGRFHDAGIYDRPFLEHQTCSCQMVLDAPKQHLSQPMTLQQVAEVQNRRLVWYLLQIDTGQTSHPLNLIEHVFGGWITEVVEELHTMHAQHGLQPIGRSPPAGFWVVRPDLLQQTLPPNQHLHPLQKCSLPVLCFLLWYSRSAKLLPTLSIPAKLQSGLHFTAHRSILPPPEDLFRGALAVPGCHHTAEGHRLSDTPACFGRS